MGDDTIQCLLCGCGTLWDTEEEIKKLPGFVKVIQDKKNPERRRVFYVCDVCLPGCLELLKMLLEEIEEEESNV